MFVTSITIYALYIIVPKRLSRHDLVLKMDKYELQLKKI